MKALSPILWLAWVGYVMLALPVWRILTVAQPALWRARAMLDGSDPTATVPSSYAWTPGADVSLRIFIAVLPLGVAWLWSRPSR